LNKAAIGGLGLFCLVWVASLFGRTLWLFELLSHFRLQYVIAGTALALVLAARRQWTGGAIAVAVAIANAVPVIPYLPHQAGPHAAGAKSKETVRVMAINLRHRFGDIDAARRLIRAEQPDVVLLNELLPRHLDAVMALDEMLPYRVGTAPRGKFDAVLLSRLPIVSSRIHFPAAQFLPVIEARLCRDPAGRKSCFTVIALHAPRPDFRRGQAQAETLALVGERAAAVADRRVVVMGDLNTTPFSYRFRDLLTHGGGLADAAIGARWRTTWISRFPPFGLTLDHVLVGAAVVPLAHRVADDIGSDHFPLIVDVALEAGASGRR
jgi:endonuclease/exonuclease/phosphatase (EEP) superfamily protein YafD